MQKDLPLQSVPSVRHYYVDESGDPVLFNSKGKVIIGSEGCSSHFFLGLLSVFNPVSLEHDLTALRKSLLADPKFNKKPSFLEKNHKTALGFHAKDDLPEVRDLVFDLLMAHNFKFFAVVKDKMQALNFVRQVNQAKPGYRYNHNNLYDHLVYRLFETRVHKKYEHNIYFSERGPTDRTTALKQALLKIQTRVKTERNTDSVGSINIFPPASPVRCVNLQAVDYCLWAVQRY